MSDLSIRTIRIPQLQRNWLGGDLARNSLCAILSRVQVGSITVHDGDETMKFGDTTQPDAPHAEEPRQHEERLDPEEPGARDEQRASGGAVRALRAGHGIDDGVVEQGTGKHDAE